MALALSAHPSNQNLIFNPTNSKRYRNRSSEILQKLHPASVAHILGFVVFMQQFNVPLHDLFRIFVRPAIVVF